MLAVIIVPIVILVFIYSSVRRYKYEKGIHAETEAFEYDTEEVVYYTSVIKGVYHRNLKMKDVGISLGEARCERNDHDRYAIAIYDAKDVLLGYMPRNNKWLFLYINKKYEGKIPVRVNITHRTGNNSFHGNVKIMINMDLSGLTDIKQWSSLSRKCIKLSKNSTDSAINKLLVSEDDN